MIHHSVSKIKNCSTRSFVNTTALHSNAAIFADVNKTYTISSTNCVQFCKQIKSIHLFAVQANRNSLFKINCDIFTFVRGFFRNSCIFKHMFVVRFIFSFFKFKTFVRKMPNIFIARIRLVFFHWNFKPTIFKEFYFCFAAVHIPFVITPSGNNFNIWSKSLDCKFKANLIISFSCSTMTNCNSFFLTCIFNKYFSNKRTSS